MSVKQAYKETLDEIEKCLKGIHYHLCDMEKFVTRNFSFTYGKSYSKIIHIHTRGHQGVH